MSHPQQKFPIISVCACFYICVSICVIFSEITGKICMDSLVFDSISTSKSKSWQRQLSWTFNSVSTFFYHQLKFDSVAFTVTILAMQQVISEQAYAFFRSLYDSAVYKKKMATNSYYSLYSLHRYRKKKNVSCGIAVIKCLTDPETTDI